MFTVVFSHFSNLYFDRIAANNSLISNKANLIPFNLEKPKSRLAQNFI